MHDRASLTRDLQKLGVLAGDTLFVHSSFKSLGPVEGGAGTVVSALEEVLGPQGLLLMPSFNLVERDLRAKTWDLASTPSTVGWLTEYFRSMPGTCRSDHYSHAVAARGNGAQAFVADHLVSEGLESPWDLAPWGRTYGTHSPMYRAYERGGKVLMLGVDYSSSTYIHLVEVMYWEQVRRRDPEAPYPGLERPPLGAWWDANGRLARGKAGEAACRLFLIHEYVDGLLDYVREKSSSS